MADRCINIDGALIRVSSKFDATEGSDDMIALIAIIGAAKGRLQEMATDKPKRYEDAARVVRIDLSKETQSFELNDDDLRVIAKCTDCGALVTGGLSRERHDNFHQALADLWDMLDKTGI